MINLLTGLKNLLHDGVAPPRPRPALLTLTGPSTHPELPPDAQLGESTAPTPLTQPLLRLYLFGRLRAYVGDQVAIDEHFTRRKAKALLVLLYLERGRYIPRDELLELLWPQVYELPPDSGRLKQTALVLRRALEGSRSRRTGWQYILEHDGSYFFNVGVPYYCDLEDLEQELRLAYAEARCGHVEGALAHFHRAFALRRADLLPEFAYDDWAAHYISAEREAYLEALDEAARLHEERREYTQAIELLRRATREDPLRETSTFQLMQILARTGDQADAVRVYVRLRDALASRLQLEPDQKLTSLYQAIRRDRASAAS